MNYCKRHYFIVWTLALCSNSSICFGQSKPDSVYLLKEAVITSRSFKEVIPAQKLTGEQLQSLNSFSVADAIRYFSGVQIKDYGGVGGLKTVDIRSMGTNHMGIFYDGIQLGNAQNGQIDLGKFSLDNIDEISLYNGQKSEIFQSAKDFGSSGTIYLRSRRPHFEGEIKHHLKAILRVGSFDQINPSILWEQKVSKNVCASINTEYIKSSGEYKYRYKRVYQNGGIAYDTSAIRKNGDIYAFRAEGGLYGKMDQGQWNAKIYFYDSERGIPGAIVNNVWKHSQRQWDSNFFVQGSCQKALSSKYDFLLNLKYAKDYMRYLNPDTTLMHIDNSFFQQETYVSLVNKLSIMPCWNISLAADCQWNNLNSDLAGFVKPSRLTTLVALATALDLKSVKMQASVLGSFISEHVGKGNAQQNDSVNAAPDKHEFTPALFLSYKPFSTQDLNFRTFYKEIFRMPTFNDLYYTDIGNILLEPEYTHQYNIGVQYSKSYKRGLLKKWEVQVDAYYNEVTNKIIAVPKGNGMYRWMMMNLGYVEIKGADVSSTGLLQFPHEVMLNIKLSYTCQSAQDFSKRKSPELQKITYGGQIPYIPWHNGSAIMGLVYRTWRLNYSFIYVGERYHNSANIPENYEQPWYTHDMSVVKILKGKHWDTKISLEVNNVLSQDYEVVLNYPMPQRNYKISISVEL